MNDQAQLTLDHFGDAGGSVGLRFITIRTIISVARPGLWPASNSSFPKAVRRAQITSTQRNADGHFHLNGTGVPTRPYNLEVSSDLSPSSFNFLTTLAANAAGALLYEDSPPAGMTRRFYRLANP